MTDFDSIYTRFNDDNPEALTERRVAKFEGREIKEVEEVDTETEEQPAACVKEDKDTNTESEEPVVEENTEEVEEGKVVTDKDTEQAQKKKLKEDSEDKTKQQINEEEGYQGYTNYPTWDVALWINNDEASQSEVLNLARQAEDAYELSNTLKDWVEELLGESSGMASDLLRWALNQVDWNELAEQFIENAKEIPAEEE